ncbi:hypothetical protein UlMin_044723 [Ulmus minor]
MSKSNPNSYRNSLMTQNQLVDSLTSHISLYHSHSHSHSQPANSDSNPNSYSSHRRRFDVRPDSDSDARTLRTRGHGFFIVLPDLLSHDLPSVCVRKSHGLLSRVSESKQSERRIFDATRLFASREGESIEECSSSMKNLDSVTVNKALVENFYRFAEAIDQMGGSLGAKRVNWDWIELEWLKAKRYYSIEAFKATVAGMAADVFWRKKGCIDWWGNLDASSRRKVLNAILGKAAPPLTREILKRTSSALEDEIWLFNTGAEQRYCNHSKDCPNSVSGHSSFQNVSVDNSTAKNVLGSNSSSSCFANGICEEEHATPTTRENGGPKCHQLDKSITKNKTGPSRLKALISRAKSDTTPSRTSNGLPYEWSTLGYLVTGNELPGKVLHSPSTVTDAIADEDASGSLTDLTGDVEGKTGDLLPYHILPPIVIPMSRDRSRSEIKCSHDLKSPCETVRSGSSSPRHWGMRGWFHDGANLEEACLYRDGAEVVWPSWRNHSFSSHSMIQPLPAALLQDRLIAISHLILTGTLTLSLQVLRPWSRTNIFGSNATGLALPTSDVDLVVCVPTVRNLQLIKEAGILEFRNDNLIPSPKRLFETNVNKDSNSEKSAHISVFDVKSDSPEKMVRVKSIIIQKQEKVDIYLIPRLRVSGPVWLLLTSHLGAECAGRPILVEVKALALFSLLYFSEFVFFFFVVSNLNFRVTRHSNRGGHIPYGLSPKLVDAIRKASMLEKYGSIGSKLLLTSLLDSGLRVLWSFEIARCHRREKGELPKASPVLWHGKHSSLASLLP